MLILVLVSVLMLIRIMNIITGSGAHVISTYEYDHKFRLLEPADTVRPDFQTCSCVELGPAQSDDA